MQAIISADTKIFLSALSFALLLSACTESSTELSKNSIVAPHTIQAEHITPSVERSFRPSFSHPGVIEAIQSAKVRPAISAIIKAYHFSAGQMVAKGDLLIELEDAQFQASLNIKKAQLSESQIELSLQKTNWLRGKKLLKKNVISTADYDVLESNYNAAQAGLVQS
ncbi:MAG: biotin/lipoyl-binding protein, partial [Sinobacterium sp.]|nr:biotin/lipoyl-binding protein [Sinobacterium sp.]